MDRLLITRDQASARVHIGFVSAPVVLAVTLSEDIVVELASTGDVVGLVLSRIDAGIPYQRLRSEFAFARHHEVALQAWRREALGP